MTAPDPSARSRAAAAWGEDLPAWVSALAAACDDTSQRRVADAIGYSAATVSLVMRRAYRGDLSRIEQAVRGAFMGGTVSCPALRSELPSHDCVAWQRRPYDGSNHQTVRMFQACRGCPIPEADREAVASYAAAVLFDQMAATTSGDSNPTIPADAVAHAAKPEAFAKRAERLRQRYYDLLGIDVRRTRPASAMAVQPLSASDGGRRLTHWRRRG